MDVDREDDLEDKLSITSGCQTLGRSASLRDSETLHDKEQQIGHNPLGGTVPLYPRRT